MNKPSPICYELRIRLVDEQKDLLTALLVELGEHNFVEGALDCDVEFDFDYDHFQRDYYGEFGHNLPVIVYSEDKAHLESLQKQLMEKAEGFSISLSEKNFELAPIKDQNWRESWKASFKPVDIDGQCVILPPWEDAKKFSQPYKIIIDPGMAFGTGQHETTKLCLKIYYELSKKHGVKHFDRVLDVGTGSGILAIAAKLHGAGYILGCDIDEPSIDIARENTEINNANPISYTTTPIADIPETDFDLVFANIQFRPLTKIFPDIFKRIRKNGTIIISGILAVEQEEFCAYLTSCGAVVSRVDKLNDWVGILCTKT